MFVDAPDALMRFVPIVAVVLALRLWVLEASRANRRTNEALVHGGFAVTSRDGAPSASLADLWPTAPSENVLHLLSENSIMGLTATLSLISYGWLNDHVPRWLAPSMFGVVVLAGVFTNVVVLTARAHDRPRQLDSGWAIMVELQLSAISVVVLALIGGELAPVLDALGRGDRTSIAIYLLVLVALTAAPLKYVLPDRLRVDQPARLRRRLMPLWTDLTAACPEIVDTAQFDVARQRSRYLLHRTVVEIRDCMLILSHRPSLCDGHRTTARVSAAVHLRHALQLAEAAARSSNAMSGRSHQLTRSTSGSDLLNDAKELCALAEHWPAAKGQATALQVRIISA